MKRRRSIAIELTSLLDVIFIMLFMVMGESREKAQAAENKAAEEVARAEAEMSVMKTGYDEKYAALDEWAAAIQTAEDSISIMQDKIDGYAEFDRFATIVTVELKLGSDNEKKLLVSDNKNASETITAENINELKNKLRAQLKTYESTAAEPPPVLMVFKYNTREVLYSDRTEIDGLLLDLCRDNGNFYYSVLNG